LVIRHLLFLPEEACLVRGLREVEEPIAQGR
jgi:hypothetical protein